MEGDNLIFTMSGIRGIVGKEINFEIAKKIAISYGSWLNPVDRRIVIGRDTRPSGIMIEKGVIEGLITAGFEVINLGICPTPIIIHTKTKCNIPGGIIITGSHNPQEWNGLKLLSANSLLDKTDMSLISRKLHQIDSRAYSLEKKKLNSHVKSFNPLPNYIRDLANYVDVEEV
ncbi:MAG: hypothetical protein ACW990_18225, partial [Promethearchaeota archaeon]